MALEEIKEQLSQTFPDELVTELLECYADMREAFSKGSYRSSGLEGGRFSEVVMRMLQHHTKGSYTPLGRRLPNFDSEVDALQRLQTANYHDSVRIHIPRALRVIFDVRNRRDIGHVGGDVDPNLSDGSLVMSTASWVLTELLRLFYASDLKEAQELVDAIAERRVPLIWEIKGELKVLNPELPPRETVLALLYVKGHEGATPQQLLSWSQRKKGGRFYEMLNVLNEERLVHVIDNKYYITPLGVAKVEKEIDFEISV